MYFTGGYYTEKLLNQTGLRVVVLNTNLYYDQNKLTENMKDPADQFRWADQVLGDAAKNNEKVFVLQHMKVQFGLFVHSLRHECTSVVLPRFILSVTCLLVFSKRSDISLGSGKSSISAILILSRSIMLLYLASSLVTITLTASACFTAQMVHNSHEMTITSCF